MKYRYWAVAAALALAACHNKPAADGAASDMAAGSDSDVTLPRLPASEPTDARSYLDKAAAGDAFEIESSRAILKTTGNPAIRTFANMMITAHKQSSAQLRTAAGKLHLAEGSTTLSSDQQRTLDSIKAAKGTDADQAYLAAQRDAHSQALDLHKHYASDGDVPELKQAATSIATVVQRHLDELDKLPKPQGGT